MIENLKKNLSFKFTINELSGAFGDWGTLVPFIIGYISIVGLNPAGIFFCLGITNIVLGIRYNLPLPVQPQKSIATIAISQKWSANKVISTGFGTGIVWIILGTTKILNKIVRKVPKVAVRGIQLGLALILGWSAALMLYNDYIFGIISIIIILIFINRKKVPTAIILVFLGIIFIFFSNQLDFNNLVFDSPILFQFHLPDPENLIIGMLVAGIGQIILTLTNVMIATISLIQDLFPEEDHNINANNLAINMGIINSVSPFLGGMPLCHGSGGLAAQYAFGARTGGSMIFEGILEIILGFFFSNFLFEIFCLFPNGILGAMLIYTAFLLGKISFTDFNWKSFPIILISALCCFFINITFGFVIGLFLFLSTKKLFTHNNE